MSDIAAAFVDRSRRYLAGEFLPKIERCLDQLTESQIWWRATPDANGVGNLVLHLMGNARQWIVSGVGGAPDVRERQREFDERGPVPSAVLCARLAATFREVDGVLARVTTDELRRRRIVQGTDVSGLEAIYQVVEHVALHTGQIILLTKLHAPGTIRFYDVAADGIAIPRW